jgi:hypothetical protein
MMSSEPMLGIDPVDFKTLDSSGVSWDKANEAWVVDGDPSAYCHLYGKPVERIPDGGIISWNDPSDINASSPVRKYNKSADLNYNLQEFKTFMYILGFSEDEIYLISIDEVVERVRTVYKYKHGQPSDLASQTFIKRKNISMLRGIRRAHHRIQVIKNGD